MTARKKKSAREKRVAIASVIVAATIVAGSTFAWFTSQDEVTNRLTAHADYGVSIVEDFKPPEDWVPGQEINKDVSAVNTGNVDAYVRLGILNDLKLNAKGSGVAVESDANALPDKPDNEEYIELNFKATEDSSQTDDANKVLKKANEVSTLQAGGTLVWAAGEAVKPTDAQNQKSGDDTSTGADDYDGTEQFKPTKTGLYLFKRTIYETESSNNSPVTKYSGYFFVKGAEGVADKYYALETEKGTVYAQGEFTTYAVGEDGAPENPTEILKSVSGVKLATTKDVTISNTDTDNGKLITITWYKSEIGVTEGDNIQVAAGSTEAKWIQLTYTAVTGNDVKLNIKLDSDWATNWTYKQTNNGKKIDDKNDFGYFYYNNVLPAGHTTEKLIDSVTLDSTVTQEAYNELTYDLSVVLDSIQVTKDSDEKYTDVSAKTWIENASVDNTDGKPTWKSTPTTPDPTTPNP